jgi:predicted MFS family arabinose efflux permease
MPDQTPPAAMVGLLAASCGIIVANIYYTQPLVGLIGPAVGLSAHAASLIVSLTQLGYATGLLLLVPLGDLVENRTLMVITVAASIPALLLTALAHNSAMLLAAAALTGLTSVAVQMLIPLAAHLTPEARRGQVVGMVTSGLLMGILLSRPVSSIIADIFSWRTVFFLSAGVMAAMAVLLRFTLPQRRPMAVHHYGTLLLSLLELPIKLPALRQRAAYQAAAFGAFSLFWTGVPLYLAQHFGYTQRGIAIFALVGAAGALMAPVAGRLADRGHSNIGTIGALSGIAASFGLAWLGAVAHSVVLLALAGVALDAGVQCSLVIGQRTIYMLHAEMRSRLNGVFMALFFIGGAAASAATSSLLIHAGWSGLCAVGAAFPLLALGYFSAVRR